MQTDTPQLLEDVRKAIADSAQLLQRLRDFIKLLEKEVGKAKGAT